MDYLLEKLWNYVAKDRTLTLPVRLFRLITLAACFLCLCVIVPVNLVETSLPLEVNLACISLGLFGLFCYVQSCRGNQRVGLFVSVLTSALAITWFFNGGIDGSVTLDFFPVFILALVFYRGRQRWLTCGLIILVVCLLVVTGYLFPSLVFPFKNRFDQMLDWVTGALTLSAEFGLVIWVVLTTYDREQEQLTRFAKEIAAGEENYRSVVENVTSVILRLDADGKITFINRFGAELFGYPREELVGQPVVGSIVPAVSSKGENLAEKMRDLILAPEKFLHTENENLCRDGRRIWVGWSNQPVFGEQHQLKEILCVGVDLTTKKKDDESRRRHELEMQHLQRLESLGLLAGGIAHDFNNLLTAILANVSLVRMDTPPNSENSGLLHEAEKASLQARDLTTQLLTFAKGGKPVKTPVNLEKIIRDCAGFALRGKNARCEFNFSASLHPVEADAAQIAQVFNNLFLNACQAMPGGGRISVTAQNRTVIGGDSTLATSGDYVEVTVADEGEGIGSENLPKIFDPYFTTKKTGSGLGLAVVHSIVSNHLGAITAESQPGHGTKFILLLPASHQTPVAPAAVTDISETACRRVLVMDDEEMVRRVLEKILVRLGCEVHSVPDGQAALDAYQKAAAEKKPFDLVIMDLTVPGGMGGQECVRRLLMLDPQARAIVSSGYADNPVLADHHAYGFRSVVTKPYTTVQMQAAMQIALAP